MQPQNEINVNFSARLKDLINKSPHKQKEISAQTGISESGIANYKKGRIPKGEELFKLAQFFEISMEELLTGRELSSAESRALKVNMFNAEHDPNAPDPTNITPEQVKRMEELEEVLDEDGELDMAKYWERDKRRKTEQNGDKIKPKSISNRDLELENAVLKGQLDEARRALQTVVASLEVTVENKDPATSLQDLGKDDLKVAQDEQDYSVVRKKKTK